MLRMQTAAFMVVAASGVWLVGVALLMALRPRRSLELLDVMVQKLSVAKWPLTLVEQGLRILVAAALIVRSPASKLPALFEVGGWMILITSVLVIVLPGRWHVATEPGGPASSRPELYARWRRSRQWWAAD